MKQKPIAMLKRLLASFLLIVFLANTVFVPATQAQWYNQDPVQFYNHVYDSENPEEIFGERYTAAQVDWIIMSFLSWPIVKSPLGPSGAICAASLFQRLATNDASIDIEPCIKAIFGPIKTIIDPALTDSSYSTMDSFLAISHYILNDRPLSGITYTKNAVAKLNPVSEVKAQQSGFGYSRFTGLTQEIWKNSRDIAYGLFVILTIILAFMIMFRVKTSPQTTITVQSALPKIAITLALITFSYAIAGFLVDLMYIVIGIISLIFSPVVSDKLPGFLISGGGSRDVFFMITQGPLYTGVIGHLIFHALAMLVLLPFALFATLGWVLGIITIKLALIANLAGGYFLIFFIGLIVLIILTVIILFIYLKTILTLIKAFAMVIILVMFAPLQIALGLVIPNFGFSQWARNLASHLAVFPTIGLILTLAYLFIAESFNALVAALPFDHALGVESSGFNIGGGWPPLLGTSPEELGSLGGAIFGNPGPLILLSISIVILSLAPKAADIVKSLVSGRPFSYGSALGEAFALGGITGAIIGGAQRKAGTGIADALWDEFKKMRATGRSTGSGPSGGAGSGPSRPPTFGQRHF